ncbi:MAG: molybdopterin molybdotransferase MoeA [Candidatus Bathyarchaeia archaeon]
MKVYKKPTVAIISTGPELIPAGEELSPGKVYDVNSYTLEAAVKMFGGVAKSLGILRDDPQIIRDALLKATSEADIILTSGGVSVGPQDLVPKVLHELDEPGVLISGVAIRPGKPMTLAIVRGKPIFALPGQPTSALLSFYLFVRPVILRVAGREVTPLKRVKAVVDRKLFPSRGRRTFIMVSLRRDRSRGLVASPVPIGLSGAITTLLRADGYVEVLEDQQFIDEGEEVTVHLLKLLDETGVQPYNGLR